MQRVEKAIKEKACNALLLKVSLTPVLKWYIEVLPVSVRKKLYFDYILFWKQVNQIGSVTESIEAVKMSKRAGWGVMASHRSGETEDTFIADLSVGLATVIKLSEKKKDS